MGYKLDGGRGEERKKVRSTAARWHKERKKEKFIERRLRLRLHRLAQRQTWSELLFLFESRAVCCQGFSVKKKVWDCAVLPVKKNNTFLVRVLGGNQHHPKPANPADSAQLHFHRQGSHQTLS